MAFRVGKIKRNKRIAIAKSKATGGRKAISAVHTKKRGGGGHAHRRA